MKKKGKKNKISKMINRVAGVATFATGVLASEMTIVKNANAAQKVDPVNSSSILQTEKNNKEIKILAADELNDISKKNSMTMGIHSSPLVSATIAMGNAEASNPFGATGYHRKLKALGITAKNYQENLSIAKKKTIDGKTEETKVDNIGFYIKNNLDSIFSNPKNNGIKTDSVVMGTGAETLGLHSTGIGFNALTKGQDAVAIGTGAQATGRNTISIGTGNVVSGEGSGAIGDPTTITGTGTYSLGNDNGVIAASNSGVFGNNNSIKSSSSEIRVIGNNNTVNAGVSDALVFGNNATVSGNSTIAIGSNSKISNGRFGIAIGKDSTSFQEGAIAIGKDSSSLNKSTVALGYNSKASGGQSVAIGGNIQTDRGAQATGDQSISIGGDTVASGSSSIAIGGDDLDAANRTVGTLYRSLTGAPLVGTGYRSLD